MLPQVWNSYAGGASLKVFATDCLQYLQKLKSFLKRQEVFLEMWPLFKRVVHRYVYELNLVQIKNLTNRK